MRLTVTAGLLSIVLCLYAGLALSATLEIGPPQIDVPDVSQQGQPQSGSASYPNLSTTEMISKCDYELIPVGNFLGLELWPSAFVRLVADVPASTFAAQSASFQFDITPPDITPLHYNTPISPTSQPVAGELDCSWNLVSRNLFPVGGVEVSPGTGMLVTSFLDTVPRVDDAGLRRTDGWWAWAQIEEACVTASASSAFVVQGYESGDYVPALVVARGAMAVFIARAAGYTDSVTSQTFPDVPTLYWAFNEVERCVAHNVVQGYPDNLYRPGTTVTRDQMAVYIQRAAEFPTTIVTTAPFADVPVGFWAASQIKACVDAGVVQGYPDGYHPAVPVTRDQMAVFVQRAFPRRLGTIVILARPAVRATRVSYNGSSGHDNPPSNSWAQIHRGPATDPGFAYIGLDIFQMDPTREPLLSEGLRVRFELRSNAGTPVPDTDVQHQVHYTVTAAELASWKTACVAAQSGIPYYWCGWTIPTGLTPGTYTLVTILNGMEITPLTGALPYSFVIE